MFASCDQILLESERESKRERASERKRAREIGRKRESERERDLEGRECVVAEKRESVVD